MVQIWESIKNGFGFLSKKVGKFTLFLIALALILLSCAYYLFTNIANSTGLFKSNTQYIIYLGNNQIDHVKQIVDGYITQIHRLIGVVRGTVDHSIDKISGLELPSVDVPDIPNVDPSNVKLPQVNSQLATALPSAKVKNPTVKVNKPSAQVKQPSKPTVTQPPVPDTFPFV